MLVFQLLGKVPVSRQLLKIRLIDFERFGTLRKRTGSVLSGPRDELTSSFSITNLTLASDRSKVLSISDSRLSSTGSSNLLDFFKTALK